MASGHSSPPACTDFFRNYNRIIGVAYLAILALTFGFFLYQLQQNLEDEIETIRGHVQRHGQLIEIALRKRVDMVDALRIAATDYYAGTSTTSMPRLFSKLRQQPSGFDLDEAPERDSTGNLVGLGSLKSRSAPFYRDVGMALGLNSMFQTIAFNLPTSAGTRFVSVEHFSHVYPWLESSKRPFSQSIYETPTWQMGTPRNNPDQHKYWAPVVYGGPEVGLLAPVAAPIYDANSESGTDSFRGMVSIDTSLDYFNRLNADFGYKLGVAFLVDAHDQVVAHPEWYADMLAIKTTRPLAEAMPQNLHMMHTTEQLQTISADVAHEADGYLVFRHPFIAAPWQLIYVVPKNSLWIALLADRAPMMLLVFVGLTLLMVVTYRVTSQEFISPAAKLVAHIAAESDFTPAPIPAVPSAWRPWFESISKAFKESLQLVSIRQELDIAARMQHAILPRTWPQGKEFALWGSMRSAKEVGGDFYDHFPLENGRIGIVVADVSDKGVPAALFGMVSKTLIRSTAMQGGEPGTTVEVANNILCENNDACMFVTTLYAVFDPAKGTFTYVNAGHPPPLLMHADGAYEFLPATGGTALGVVDGISFRQEVITLKVGDVMIIYTDGVTESFNEQGEEFTLMQLPLVFARHPPESVSAAVERVISAVDAHAGKAPQSDDITCIALQYAQTGGAS